MVRIAIATTSGKYVNYVNALTGVGAEAVLTEGKRVDPAEFDGLLMPGGVDVAPSRFGEEMNGTEEVDEELDAHQFQVLDDFVRAGKPVLGICRGHQLINVYFGGSLIQNLENAVHHRWRGDGNDQTHESRTEEGSWVRKLYGLDEMVTNSAHHQAVKVPGKGLVADMFSDDGINEAMHHESLPVYCVQWHPERMCFANRREDTVDGRPVFDFFLQICGGSPENFT